MNDIKFMMLTNVVLRLGFCICVTIAAIHFDNAMLLWMYLLSFLMGWTVED